MKTKMVSSGLNRPSTVEAIYRPSHWTVNPEGLSYIPRFNVGTVGPIRVRAPNQQLTPLDYFTCFFDDRCQDLKPIGMQHRSSGTSFSHQRPWRDVNREEMKAYIGLIMAFEIVKLPRIEMYWQRKYPIFEVPSLSFRTART